jgi:hypothetical protein
MTIRREDIHKIDLSDTVTGERMSPVRPGDILREDFLEPLNLSARAGEPDNRNPERRARDQRLDCHPTQPAVRCFSGVLAQAAERA